MPEQDLNERDSGSHAKRPDNNESQLEPVESAQVVPAALPPMPEPFAYIGKYLDDCTDVFTGDQMQAYARAALAAEPVKPPPALADLPWHQPVWAWSDEEKARLISRPEPVKPQEPAADQLRSAAQQALDALCHEQGAYHDPIQHVDAAIEALRAALAVKPQEPSARRHWQTTDGRTCAICRCPLGAHEDLMWCRAPAEPDGDEPQEKQGYCVNDHAFGSCECAEEARQGCVSWRGGGADTQADPVPGMVLTLRKRIEHLSERHGSLRAVARLLALDPGYLSRLASGERDTPSDETLAALGLERVVSYRVKPSPAQGEQSR